MFLLFIVHNMKLSYYLHPSCSVFSNKHDKKLASSDDDLQRQKWLD